ncbi:MAG: hypothetical protein ACXVGH_06460, partial [Mycobacteriales bacterium]
MPSTRSASLVGAALVSLALVPLSPALSYGVRSVTAGLAIASLLRVGIMPGRRSRQLLAAALGVGVLSGLVATAHLLVTGAASPP